MTKKFYLTLCMLVLSIVSYAQDGYTVTGTVVDEMGQPIIGATVVEKDDPINGAATDYLGQFTLTATSGESMLIIRYAGYTTVEYQASSEIFKSPVVLQEDAVSIGGVTVVGYGTLRKSDMTGSVEVVGADLDDRGMVNSASELLLGKVSGLQITQGNGQPGSGSSIRIRGGSSLSANNNPLVVIDGVPVSDNANAGMSNPLGNINPNDIESFTILKDASSAAIYGSRGANGVIIITTKKGKAGGFKLNYNSDYSVGFNTKTVETLSPTDYRSFITDTYGAGSIQDLQANQYPDANTTWSDHIYQAAFGTNQYLSGSGRMVTDAVQMGYRVSLGYTHQDGTLMGSEYNRYTVDVGLAPKFFDEHLSVDINFKGTMSNQDIVDAGVIGNAAFFDPTKPITADYSGETWAANRPNVFNGYFAYADAVTGLPDQNTALNPISQLTQQYNNDESYRMIANVAVDYKMHFLPELRANLNLGYDASQGKNINGSLVNSEQAWRDAEFRGIGRYNEWTGYRRNSLLDFYLNYANDFGKHRVDAMAGYSWQLFDSEDYNSTYGNDAAEGSTPFNSTYDATQNYLVSFFGRLNYSYDNRYMVTATVRYDGSSRFSPDNRWGIFPSVAAGWNIAEESFLKGSVVDNLKIRGSWGVTGQQDIPSIEGVNPDYPYQANYNLSTQFSQYQFGNMWYHMLAPDAYDENIKWEETTSWNVGVDFSAFNSRLNITVDAYQKFTEDLLYLSAVPAGTNFATSVLTNVGDLENKGIEVEIGGDIIRNQDWRWNVTANATWQETVVTNLTASNDPNYLGAQFGNISIGTGTSALINAVGYAPSSYYLFEQVYDVDGNPVQNTVVDRNGDGQISDADRYIAGNIQPTMYYGFSTSLSYKNWDFALNAHGVLGNEIFNDYNMAHSTTYDAWSSGTGTLNNIAPVYKTTGFTGINTTQQNLSDYWLEDGSYLRIDNITLGYNFSGLFSAGDSKGLGGRVSLTVQNPLLVTKYTGLDPETSWGIDGVIWPRPTTVLLGLSLSF